MSYGMLRHGNQSSQALNQLKTSPSPPLGSDSDSDRQVGIGLRGGEISDEDDYELEELSSHASTGFKSQDEYDPRLDESEDEDERPDVKKRRRQSDSTVQSFTLYTPDEEKAIMKKFDRRLVLFVALLYMLSFLDRSNIGNARIAGMEEDLNLSSYQYEWLLRAFYISYILFEWMTLLWKVIPPHIYLAVCVASWGLIASLQALAFSFPSLLALRAALGIGEAAFVGVPFYMSFFYKRDELAFRTGLFISAAPLATSFASSLAWVITKIGTKIPIASWRLLFLVEGFPSMIVAVFVFLYIPDNPQSARYLTPRERRVAQLRLRKDKCNKDSDNGKRGLQWREIARTIIDPKSYLTALMFFCANVAFSSLPVFLPTIIKEMGYTAQQAQALSAPPYLVAFVSVLLTAHLSDHLSARFPPLILHALLSSLSYTLLSLSPPHLLNLPPWARYTLIYPITTGFFSTITLIITWTLNNQPTTSSQGTGMAILNYIGQLGPLVGVHLYPEEQGPYYVRGMGACAGAMGGVAVGAGGLRWWLGRENRRRERREWQGEEGNEGEGEGEGLVVGEGDGRSRRRRRGREERFVYML